MENQNKPTQMNLFLWQKHKNMPKINGKPPKKLFMPMCIPVSLFRGLQIWLYPRQPKLLFVDCFVGLKNSTDVLLAFGLLHLPDFLILPVVY